jgi:PhnB protein
MPEYTGMDRLERALADLPRAEFKARLKADLERSAAMTMAVDSRADTTRAKQSVTPQLRVADSQAAIDFYTRAFGARELMRFEAGGHVAHAELLIGSSVVFLGDEAPDWGFPSAGRLGGSPVAMQLQVDDADAAVARAVAAGARLLSPVADQFYGDRSGRVADPFGYTWTIATRKEEMSVEEMHRRMAALAPPAPASPVAFRREGFRTVTPYVVVNDVPGLIEFTERAFGAREDGRTTGGAGMHAEVQIGDSKLMIGGGSPQHAWRGDPLTAAFHIYVPDVDAAFARAVQAGGTAIQEPADMEYGERSGGVKDAFGNVWYIATAQGERHVPAGLQTVTVYLHPHRADPLIAFMRRAFDAEEIEKYASPDGIVHHAKVRIGDSPIEMGEAHGPYQPMPTRFYLYLPNVDVAYQRAIDAGAISMTPPQNQPYGERVAGVKDVFGNQWFIAARIAG